MATTQQINANQHNAKHSTGPKTEEGKQRSALNSSRHGLTGQTIILTEQEKPAYDALAEGIIADLSPKGILEENLVHSIMNNRWRVAQIACMESALYALGQRAHFHEFSTETPETAAALCRLKTFEEKRKELDRLRRYENSLNRQANTDLAQLQNLQSIRKAKEAQQQKDAIALHTHFTTQGKPWNPADFGFVLSIQQIEQLEQRTFLRNQVCKA
jgi:hypothetical protein